MKTEIKETVLLYLMLSNIVMRLFDFRWNDVFPFPLNICIQQNKEYNFVKKMKNKNRLR